jgi:hypothetical protein
VRLANGGHEWRAFWAQLHCTVVEDNTRPRDLG